MKSRGAWDLNASKVIDMCDAGYKNQANVSVHFYWLWYLVRSHVSEFGKI